MCGRFTKNYDWEQVRDYLDLILSRAPSNFPPDFNVCPTDLIDAVIKTDQGREMITMRWGIIPSWWSVSARVNSSRADKTDATLIDRFEIAQPK